MATTPPKEQFVPVPTDADHEPHVSYEEQKAAFRVKLRKVIPTLISWALILAVLAFVILVVRFIIETYIVNGREFFWSHFEYVLKALLIGLAICLYALPLALPVALALIYVQKGNYAIRFRRWLQYQVTVNLVAGLVAFIAAVVAKSWFITIAQILYINIIVGILAAIGLCVTLAKTEIYSLTKDRQPILGRRLIANVKGQLLYQLAVIFILIYLGPVFWDIDDNRWGQPHEGFGSLHMTIVFNAFFMMCLFNQINARKIYGERNIFQNIHKDVVFVVMWVLQLVFHIFLVELKCRWVDISPDGLTFAHWLWSVAAGLGTLLWMQVIDIIPCKNE